MSNEVQVKYIVHRYAKISADENGHEITLNFRGINLKCETKLPASRGIDSDSYDKRTVTRDALEAKMAEKLTKTLATASVLMNRHSIAFDL